MKEEDFRAYMETERVKRPVPMMPKDRWDSVEEYLLYLRHVASYVLLAEPLVTGKNMLEVGCGTGYGAAYLSEFASSIVAIDIWKEGISYCQAKYARAGLGFMLADGIKLPFKDNSFDVVLSFEVIEHIDPKMVSDYLGEIKRVMKKQGAFILSTPNKKLRLLPFQKPWNPEHKREYNHKQLKRLLSKVFEMVEVYGLCGSEEVLSIERNRVKQNALTVYVMGPLYQSLKHVLPSAFLFQLKRVYVGFLKARVSRNPVAQESFLSKLSVDDFTIDPSCPEDCISLLGICYGKAGLHLRPLPNFDFLHTDANCSYIA